MEEMWLRLNQYVHTGMYLVLVYSVFVFVLCRREEEEEEGGEGREGGVEGGGLVEGAGKPGTGRSRRNTRAE